MHTSSLPSQKPNFEHQLHKKLTLGGRPGPRLRVFGGPSADESSSPLSFAVFSFFVVSFAGSEWLRLREPVLRPDEGGGATASPISSSPAASALLFARVLRPAADQDRSAYIQWSGRKLKLTHSGARVRHWKQNGGRVTAAFELASQRPSASRAIQSHTNNSKHIIWLIPKNHRMFCELASR